MCEESRIALIPAPVVLTTFGGSTFASIAGAVAVVFKSGAFSTMTTAARVAVAVAGGLGLAVCLCGGLIALALAINGFMPQPKREVEVLIYGLGTTSDPVPLLGAGDEFPALEAGHLDQIRTDVRQLQADNVRPIFGGRDNG